MHALLAGIATEARNRDNRVRAAGNPRCEPIRFAIWLRAPYRNVVGDRCPGLWGP